jgi:hypothetical protein
MPDTAGMRWQPIRSDAEVKFVGLFDGDKSVGYSSALSAASEWQHQFLAKQAQGHEKALTPKTNNAASESVAGPNWQQIGQTAKQVLFKIDPQGKVSLPELATAMQNDKFTGQEAQALAAVYHNFDRIQNLAGGSRVFRTSTVTTGDIDALVNVATVAEKEYHDRDNLAYWAVTQGNLKKLSPGGALTEQNVKVALATKNLAANDKANLEELQANFGSIANGGKVGASQLVSYLNNFKDSANFKLDDSFLHDMELVDSSQKDSSPHKLFANETAPAKSVTLDGLNQGHTGDCAFEAALAGLVELHPEAIPKMFQSANGNFQVSFPSAKGHDLEVKPITEAERGLFDQANPAGDWNNVLKKGYGQLVSETNAKVSALAKSKTPEELAAEDGYQDQAISTLTNHRVDNEVVKQLSTSDLNNDLLQASKDHRIVVFNTAPASPTSHTKLGFETGHAFTVIKVDSEGGKVTSLVVRDPRNHGANKPDGTMQVTLQDVQDNFRTVSIETNKPL